MYKYGCVFQGSKSKWTNKVIEDENGCRIVTAKGEEIMVDRSSLPVLTRHSWCISKTGYAVANISKRVTKMHRLLMDCPDNLVVDHINGNPLDNRRANLRVCTPKNNSRNKGLGKNNSTGIMGISPLPGGRWRARIMVNREEKALGHFDSLEDAIKARRDAEARYFGQFARVMAP